MKGKNSTAFRLCKNLLSYIRDIRDIFRHKLHYNKDESKNLYRNYEQFQ